MNLHEEYHPNQQEEYMSESQLNYFQRRLIDWREELIEASKSFIQSLQECDNQKPDPLDQSAANIRMTLDYHTRKLQSRMIEQIDYALYRIAEGEYGYCEVTGEEIGLPRLMARPVATMCVEVQERHEQLSRRMGSAALV